MVEHKVLSTEPVHTTESTKAGEACWSGYADREHASQVNSPWGKINPSAFVTQYQSKLLG